MLTEALDDTAPAGLVADAVAAPCGPRHGLGGSRNQAGRPKRRAYRAAHDGTEPVAAAVRPRADAPEG